MAKNKAKLVERLSSSEILRLKEDILANLDSCASRTLAQAARDVNVSPTKAYHWMKSDDNFRGQVKQARKVLGDQLIEDLLDLPDDAKMPIVTSKIFLIKGLHPEFRDNYKVVEFKDQRAIKLLEELRELGKEEPKPKPKVEEPDNPLQDTIDRVNAEQSTD